MELIRMIQILMGMVSMRSRRRKTEPIPNDPDSDGTVSTMEMMISQEIPMKTQTPTEVEPVTILIQMTTMMEYLTRKK